MTITIDISPETLRRLRVSASIKGENIENVVEEIVERSVPTLDEAAAPLREAIAASGMSEAEAEAFFDEVLREVRTEKAPRESMIEAVFDTNTFLQAAVSERGPAHACWKLAEKRAIRVFVTENILAEIKDVFTRPKVVRQFPRLSSRYVENTLAAFRTYCSVVSEPPSVFELPRDIDDAKFVNLAANTKASFIVTWDGDLLDLMGDSAFRNEFPALAIVPPDKFLEIARAG